MSETYTVHDPFLGKDVEIFNGLVERLHGKYAVGPMMENGEPEFGWRKHDVPPINIEAAAEIMRLRDFIRSLDGKHVGIRTDGDTFIDEAVIVAADILGSKDEQKAESK